MSNPCPGRSDEKGCSGIASGKLHLCPYKFDVDDDHETLCYCCPYCTEECAQDI